MSDLPYTQPFHQTPQESLEARRALERKVPAELAGLAVDFGYNPWVVKRNDELCKFATQNRRIPTDPSVTGWYLCTDPLPTSYTKIIPQRIIFQTRAADQGWATFGGDGTFENSHTWFEASIIRPMSPSTPAGPEGLEDCKHGRWTDVEDARMAINACGWDFAHDPDGRVSWKVCNNITASKEFRNYHVEWRRDVETEVEDERAKGKGKGFLESLTAGSIVVLWARAEVSQVW